MSDQLFLITGGGTGAKVAESFIHLCAAGVAPAEVHVLLVDTDATNGNVQRTTSAEQAYSNLQSYPWSVQTTAKEGGIFNTFSSGEDVGTNLFASDLFMYRLTDPLATVIGGGLDTAVGDNSDIRQVLELLYDGNERAATCDDGFRARPNLGCLHLADHLNKVLKTNRQARDFVSALANAASSTASDIPVVVTASVFGGTGASLIPVVRGCVEQALQNSRGNVDTDRLHWSAIKMLPHYQPKHRKASVDPDRFLLDTASALQFYSKVYRDKNDVTYDSVYVIGSDRPGRNTVEPKLGSDEQSNPSYFEEFLASLAVLHAGRHLNPPRSEQVRLFMPGANAQAIQWNVLPFRDPKLLRERFGYLLHLAAFYLRQGGNQDFSQGLERLLSDISPDHLRQMGWYGTVIDPWARNAPAYEAASTSQRPAMIRDDSALGNLTYSYTRKDIAEYFGRLLMWTETALKGGGLSLVDYRDSDYAAIHSAMSSLGKGDVDTVQVNGTSKHVRPDEDNAMVRTLRAALATMVRVHHNDVRVKISVDDFRLIDSNQRIPLAITRPEIQKAMSRNGLQGILDAHTRTLVA